MGWWGQVSVQCGFKRTWDDGTPSDPGLERGKGICPITRKCSFSKLSLCTSAYSCSQLSAKPLPFISTPALINSFLTCTCPTCLRITSHSESRTLPRLGWGFTQCAGRDLPEAAARQQCEHSCLCHMLDHFYFLSMLIMQFPVYCISSAYPSHLSASHIGSDISLITPVWFLVSTILIIHQVTLWCYPWFILKNSLSYKVSVFTTFRKLLCLNKVSVYCWPFQSGTMHLWIYYLLPFLIKPLRIILCFQITPSQKTTQNIPKATIYLSMLLE